MRRVTGVFLLVVMVVAMGLRVVRLGQASLDVDEYLHVLPAQAWLTQGSPLLPSGNAYRRALPYTAAVALAMRITGRRDEATARIPSVIAGMALIFLLYVSGRRWFGEAAGCWAAAFAALHPILISSSRLCRMYSWLEVLYLLLIFVMWEGVWRPGLSWRRRALGVCASGFLLLFLLVIHKLSSVFVIAFAAFLAGVALRRPRSPETVWLFAGLVLLGAAALLHWVDLARVWHDFNYAPSWAQQSRYQERFYWDLWVHDLPWLLPLSPLLLGWLVWRRGKLGWYLAAMVVVPFALHSFIFDWKAPRYLSYTVAPLLLALSFSIVAIGRRVAGFFGGKKPWAVWGIALLGLGLLGGPLVRQTWQLFAHPTTPVWREACAYLASNRQPEDVVLADEPLALQYYLKVPSDYILNNLRYADFSDRLHRDRQGRWLDWYSGRPHLTDEAAFLELIATHPRGWLVMPRYNFESAKCTPPSIRQWFAQHGTRHLLGADDTMVVYSWQLKEPGST